MPDPRLFDRARRLAISSLVGLGRRTVTGMMTAGGRSDCDWTADYRLFSRSRMDAPALFDPVRRAVGEALKPGAPFSVMIDDVLLRKSGRKIPGAQHFRDPLGPKFHLNPTWAQRFLQISAALPDPVVEGRARGVPLMPHACPLPRKPSKKATDEQKEAYRRERDEARLGVVAGRRLRLLRERLDADGHRDRKLICSGDGGHTHRTVLGALPERTAFIGRIRKDAKLHAPPPERPEGARGRKRVYGPALPTPREILRDEKIESRSVPGFAAGKTHDFKIKVVDAVRWRAAGNRDLRLVIIAPLGYRLAAGQPLLYREPAFLICTDPTLEIETLLQNYLWRWQIEVNFREEKTTLGLGQAQVRTEDSVRNVPALQTAAYATLLMALHEVCPVTRDCPLPTPRWQKPQPEDRLSTAKAIGLLRCELWGLALGHFSDFASPHPRTHEALEMHQALPHAVIYGVN